MIKTVFTSCLLVLVLHTTLAHADNSEAECGVSHARQIVDAILNVDYRMANQIRQAWLAEQPDSLHPAFYQASILLAQVDASREDAAQALRNNALHLLKVVTDKLTKQSLRSAQDELILGMSEAFIARIHMDQARWFDAYSMGRKARNRLQHLIRQFPETEDAYLVLGLYEYYTGNVPIGLKWLTRLIDLSGDKQQGLVWLQRVVEKADTASPEAARILIDELELQAPEVCQWISLNEQLRAFYPSNPRLSWLLQKNYRICGYPEKALQENRLGYQQFRLDRRIRSRLLSQRLLIFRDLGNVEMMQRYRKRFKPDYFAERLKEARAVNDQTDANGYRQPPTIKNDLNLQLTYPCQPA